jgi:hypothetical protein
MPMSEPTPEIIKNIFYLAAFIGGVVGGAFGLKKLPLTRKESTLLIERSDKTGGAIRISEEALEKLNEMKQEIKNDYLRKEKHEDWYGRLQAETKLYIADQFEDHTQKIITAIKSIQGVN